MKCEWGSFLKGWRIKGRLWKAQSVTQVTFTAVKQSRTSLWECTGSRDGSSGSVGGGNGERGVHWDKMDTGAEGGRVRRAGVEEWSSERYPCVTPKPNTYLVSCKMAVSAGPPPMGTAEWSGPSRTTQPPLGHTWWPGPNPALKP